MGAYPWSTAVAGPFALAVSGADCCTVSGVVAAHQPRQGLGSSVVGGPLALTPIQPVAMRLALFLALCRQRSAGEAPATGSRLA